MECHYAYYDTGSFYKKHIDQFRSDSGRKYSMVLYLNENWQPHMGGQLVLYADQDVQIDPLGGRMVFFKSDKIAHEVLLSNAPRLSIAGWLKT
jgi:SM-20-related protein